MGRPGTQPLSLVPAVGDAVAWTTPAHPDVVRHGLVRVVQDGDWFTVDTGATYRLNVHRRWITAVNFARVR